LNAPYPYDNNYRRSDQKNEDREKAGVNPRKGKVALAIMCAFIFKGIRFEALPRVCLEHTDTG